MRLKIRNGFIYDEDEKIVGTLDPEAGETVEKTIEAGSEAIPAIMTFLQNSNQGSMKPKANHKMFQAILDKYDIVPV